MNVCSIGRPFPHAGTTQIRYNSTQTVLDYDAVFLDPVGLYEESQLNPSAIRFRRDEFSEFLALGRTIVVFASPFQSEVILPVQRWVLKPISGSRVDFKGSDHFGKFWNSVKADMQFLAFFETAPGKPFLFISETSKAIASLVKHGPGNILILPWLKIDRFPANYAAVCANFMAAFRKLNEHLEFKKQKIILPAWAAHYGWEQEQSHRSSLTSLQAQVDMLVQQIIAKERELELEDNLKLLFAGTGEPLVEIVISVLRELGLHAKPGETGRDDIIIEFEHKHAVIEVKGKKSSAAESDAAQLEKWVSGFKEDKGKDAKGILLVNAFCETPLAERNNDAFPNQMLKYCTQREHCLMTTTQLLGLLLEARAHPAKRVDLLNSLFSTIGIYPHFADWRPFLAGQSTAPAKANK